MELAEPMDGRVGSGRRPLKGLNWSQTRYTTDIPWLLVGATNLPILIRIILESDDQTMVLRGCHNT